MAQKCPKCGSPAYIGFIRVECENSRCPYYVPKPKKEVEETYATYARIVASTPRWLSLHVAGPVDAANEANYVGYKRVQIDQGQVMQRYPVNQGGTVYWQATNTIEISFPVCTGGGSLISHLGYWDQHGLLVSCHLTAPFMYTPGARPVFAPQSIFIDVN